jgi:hypothetical protein
MTDELHLYFDDSGSRIPDAKVPDRLDGMDCFALGGVLVRPEDENAIVQAYFALCRKWNIKCPLHSTKIRGSRSGFAWLKTDQTRRDEFLTDLQSLLCDHSLLGIAAVVHRPVYRQRYEEQYRDNLWLMDKTAFSILIERSALHARDNNRILRVYFERSGPNEDNAIREYYRALKATGMPFNGPDAKKYDGLSAEDFQGLVPYNPEPRTKKTILIQLADLYLYALAKGGYDPTDRAYVALITNGRVLHGDSDDETKKRYGMKYSCFDIPEKNAGAQD